MGPAKGNHHIEAERNRIMQKKDVRQQRLVRLRSAHQRGTNLPA